MKFSKFRYDFASHIGLFLIYNTFFIIFLIIYSLASSLIGWNNGEFYKILDSYFRNGLLFSVFPAKYIHFLINIWIFFTVKFKLQHNE